MEQEKGETKISCNVNLTKSDICERQRCSPLKSCEVAHSLLDFAQKNPFFLVD